MSHPNQLANLLSVLVLSFGLAASSTFAAEPAVHGHERDGASATLTLDAGKKWPSDVPLRKAMSKIRSAMTRSWHAIEKDKFTAAQYDALAKTIQGEVGYMVSNCKLEPKADEQLHLIIADMLEGVEAMQGKVKDATRHDGAARVMDALENYGTFFDDRSWKPVKH